MDASFNSEGGYMISEKDFGEMKGNIDEINKRLDKIDTIILGNGQPGLYGLVKERNKDIEHISKKLDEMVDTFKEDIKTTREETKEAADKAKEAAEKASREAKEAAEKAAKEAKEATSSIVLKLDGHIKDTKGNFKIVFLDNWQTILLLFISGFLVLHAIIPTTFSLWTVLEKLLF